METGRPPRAGPEPWTGQGHHAAPQKPPHVDSLLDTRTQTRTAGTPSRNLSDFWCALKGLIGPIQHSLVREKSNAKSIKKSARESIEKSIENLTKNWKQKKKHPRGRKRFASTRLWVFLLLPISGRIIGRFSMRFLINCSVDFWCFFLSGQNSVTWKSGLDKRGLGQQYFLQKSLGKQKNSQTYMKNHTKYLPKCAVVTARTCLVECGS